MTHDPYGNADLVTLYDSDTTGGRDHAFCRALADELEATTVVDLGCGTGLLTRSFAALGRTLPHRGGLDQFVHHSRAQLHASPDRSSVCFRQGAATPSSRHTPPPPNAT